MKKYLSLILFFAVITPILAQNEFNKWSVEVAGGFNKPMGPLTPGYFSPTLNIGHLEFGARYMFNEYFGVKGDLGLGDFREVKRESPEFLTKYSRANLQMVMNYGRIMNFERISKRISLLGHFGAGFGRNKFKKSVFDQDPDYVYNIITGITPQIKISEKIAVVGDITYIHNGRQTYTFDGNSYNAPFQPNPPSNPFIHAVGGWWTGTIGLNFYLGKAQQHADWYIASDKYATKLELEEAVTGVKEMLKDSDGDGVADYLDKEKMQQNAKNRMRHTKKDIPKR